jgi:hypothetical protein
MGELEMELALLREENARLKVERHRPPDAGRIIERMRHLRRDHSAEEHDEEASCSDRAPQPMGECLAIRDGLLEACQDVQQAIHEVRGRLGALSVDLRDGGGDRARPSPMPVPDAEEIDVELVAGAQAVSSLAQNAA